MKAALFGSTGFVGQHLLDGLDAEVIPVNIRENAWEEQIPENVNVFINCIGKAHDHKGTATEKEYYFANVDLAKQIFSAFLKSDAKLLIHISSIAAVEEFESSEPLSEEALANPYSYYGKSKREAEKWLLSQTLPENKKLIILRPPMIHGPGDKGSLGLLYKFISKGIPYPLSAFDNHRSFISIDSFSFFIQQVIENEALLTFGIYHISDDQPVSTKQIIDIIKKTEGKKVMSLSIPKPLIQGIAKIGDILPLPLNTKRLKKITGDLVVSNQKIKTALGIEKLPLTAEEGLKKTIRSFTKK